MKRNLSAKMWIPLFFAFVSLILSLLAGIAYIIDPLFQFQVKDNTYYISAPYANAGLIKNYDYDTLIVGSCMVGNYDMRLFQEELGANALKVETGSMHPAAINAYLDYANDASKASRYYVNIDITSFQSRGTPTNEYLMKTDPISRAKYLLGYETWFRFIPVDCALMLYKDWAGELPAGRLSQRTSIDCLGTSVMGEKSGRDIVLSKRNAHLYEVSAVHLDGLYDRLITNIDTFIEQIDFSAGSFTFIFPPYSTLYWCDAQDLGYFDVFLSAKYYFIQALLAHGCAVYDFQSADLANNLDYYKDSTHYSADVNNWMTACFADGEYLVTAENQMALQKKLVDNTHAFREQNPEFFH